MWKLLLSLFLLAVLWVRSGNAFFVGADLSSPTAAATTTRSQQTRLHAIGSALKRVKDSVTSQERSREDLKLGIAGFYDRSSKLWEDVWGERTCCY